MRRSTPPWDRERRVGGPLGEDREAIDLLADEWQPDSDELTPTMKLKRRPITHKYASQIDTLYPTKETR
jgi:long-subunit acyl-CoA synthetase (AMP-forming)